MNLLVPLLLTPLFSSAAIMILPNKKLGKILFHITGAIHLTIVAIFWFERPSPLFKGWLQLDSLGLLILSLMSLLFFCASIAATNHLEHTVILRNRDKTGKKILSEKKTLAVMLLFLESMTLATISQHLGLFWIAIEATTLASAPLISYHRHPRSVEATWKYLLICSVGIALAFIGNIFLSLSINDPGSGSTVSLLIRDLAVSGRPRESLFKTAFIFLFVGYGTKIGLSPLHTWLPDAHSQAPAFMSSLLSGALLNGAFLGILRVSTIYAARGESVFIQRIFILFGLISLLTALIFMIRQRDYKRLLAYSSIEHMGILALGFGLGGRGVYGALIHLLNHSLIKGALFLIAGNILALYGTKKAPRVRFLLQKHPGSAILWIVGFLAITAFPPFGLFFSEFIIAKTALEYGRVLVSIIFFLALTLIFIGSAYVFLPMVLGKDGSWEPGKKENPLSLAAPLLLLVLSLLLGIYFPGPLAEVVEKAVLYLGGSL